MTAPLTLERLRADVAAMLEQALDTISDTDNLLDIGLDSMRAMNLTMHWEENGVPLDFSDVAEAPTIAALWALLQERQGHAG